MWSFRDYVGFVFLAIVGFVKGVWTGLAQIPNYVSAEIDSAKHTADQLAKKEG